MSEPQMRVGRRPVRTSSSSESHRFHTAASRGVNVAPVAASDLDADAFHLEISVGDECVGERQSRRAIDQASAMRARRSRCASARIDAVPTL